MKVLFLLNTFLLSVAIHAQELAEEGRSILVTATGGLCYTNYRFGSNSPYAPYAAPTVNEVQAFGFPAKVTILFHHPLMTAGTEPGKGKINFGLGLKRVSLRGSHFDYGLNRNVEIHPIIYKVVARMELILGEHERNWKTNGFGLLLEGGGLTVRQPVGRSGTTGLSLSGGGFYFFQLSDLLFVLLESSFNYDSFRTIILGDYSRHHLLSTEVMAGLRIKI